MPEKLQPKAVIRHVKQHNIVQPYQERCLFQFWIQYWYWMFPKFSDLYNELTNCATSTNAPNNADILNIIIKGLLYVQYSSTSRPPTSTFSATMTKHHAYENTSPSLYFQLPRTEQISIRPYVFHALLIPITPFHTTKHEWAFPHVLLMNLSQPNTINKKI